MLASNGDADAPNEQCQVMRSVGLSGLVTTGGFVKRNWPHPARLIWPHPRGQDRDGRPHCVGVRLSAQL